MDRPPAGDQAAVRRDARVLEIAARRGQQDPPLPGRRVDHVDLVRPVPRLVPDRPAGDDLRAAPGDPPAAGAPTPAISAIWAASSRGRSGPGSWSQYRSGPDSCRIAVPPASLRAFRRLRSSSAPSAPGSPGAAKTTVPVPRPVATPVTPPGGAAILRASPPPAGSSHSAGLSWPTSSSASGPGPGPRRLETNSSEPSRRNSGAPSPPAPRVSRAGQPVRPLLVFRSAFT